MNENSKITLGITSGLMALIFVLIVIFGLGDSCDTTGTATPDQPVFATTAPVDENAITLSFIGDCILTSESGEVHQGNFAWYAENKSHDYFFEGVYDVLSQDDLTFANCECVLSDNKLQKRHKGDKVAFWFIGPAQNADILKLGSVEVAGVANNHTYDYGEQGCLDTVEALEAQGIRAGQDIVPLYVETKGVRIGIVYCSFWGSYQTKYIENALEEMEGNCDYKIVYFHGGTEGTHYPSNYLIDACRHMAEEELCDLIIGAHPHVLQPMEVVNDVPIVYSLGNFCYGGNTFPENKTVIFQAILSTEGDRITTSTNIIPCYVYTGSSNNWQPKVITDEGDKQEILRMMSEKVEHRQESSSSTSASSTATNAPTTAPKPTKPKPEVQPTATKTPDPTEPNPTEVQNTTAAQVE